jgi:ABC-type hemin transport system ATPase subunit
VRSSTSSDALPWTSAQSRRRSGHATPTGTPARPPSGGYVAADEPTGRLDEELSTHVLTTLREVCAAAGTGVLLASHDPVVVAAADRVVRLSDGLVVEG